MTTPPSPLSTTSEQRACCREYARLSRRSLLGAVALGGATTVLGDAVLQTSASARTTPAESVLVVLSLRGAADGLSMVVPHGDPVYRSARGNLQVKQVDTWGGDGFFGWNDDLDALAPLWRDNRLAAVHAVGLPMANRSHFAAMEEVEDADPTSTVRTGWLNRLVGATTGPSSPLKAVTMDPGVTPSSLAGPAPIMNASRVENVRVAGVSPRNDRRMRSLNASWGRERGALGAAARSSFAAARDFRPVADKPAPSRPAAAYPRGSLGKALAEAARVVRGDVGVEVLTIDHGAWDMHSNLGVNGGDMSRHCQELAGGIAAFFDDLGSFAEKVTLVTVTEFGRRVQVNSNQGLDHGWGSVMLLAGAGVRGGRFYADFPDLNDTLDADLTVTTDYRTVLAEVVESRFGVSRSALFPGFNDTRRWDLMQPA